VIEPSVQFTIVIPVYYNEESLRELTEGLHREVLQGHERAGRILFVDDGSGDGSYAVLRALHAEYGDLIRVVKLSRNFGQVNAIWCGLTMAEGVAVVMSADGQDSPRDARRLLDAYFGQDCEVVVATRSSRDESAYRRWTSAVFYWLMRHLAFPEMPDGGFDFFLVGPRARAALLKRYHYHGFLQGQLLSLGFPRVAIAADRRARQHGRSRWTFSRKVTYLLDGILGYSFLPIRGMSLGGVLVALLGFAYAALIFVKRLLWGHPIEGWTPLMIVILVLGGLQMLMLGALGEYLWRTFAHVRATPPYVIEEVLDGRSRCEGGLPADGGRQGEVAHR